MKSKNCINCGAPLRSNICDYCGTEYEIDEKGNHNSVGRQLNEYIYELDICGEKHNFYVGNIEANVILHLDVHRDVRGNIQNNGSIMKRTLTLIEI